MIFRQAGAPGSKELFPQRAGGVVELIDAAPLQFRNDQFDDVGECFRCE
jgi:hypothetical protein